MSSGGDRDRLELRGRVILDEWFWVVVLVAIVLTAAGGYATYTAYEAPGTISEERQVASWEGNGSYTTAATVTERNPLFPVGTELTDRPAYFRTVSPRLDGTFAFEYEASDGGSLDVSVQQTLVLRSIEEREDRTIEYWRIESPLNGTETTGVGPGDAVTVAFSRDINRSAARLADVSDRFGPASGSTQILVVARVAIEGEVNGRTVDRNGTYTMPIGVGGTVYAPGAVRGEAFSGSTTELVTRERTYGPLYRIGGPVALLFGVVGSVGLGYGRYDDRFAVSGAERTALDFESTREEFDDWITTASLPQAVLDRPRVDVDSLEGLVDTAIDVEARVFETPRGDAFYVPHEDLLYVYEPPTAGRDATLGGEAATTGDGESVDGTADEDADGTADS
ncbi:DUF5305 domain-containing protein [Haloplanus halophilus]|uniref:DUF5305 domain-containing protein n=1 Tax=Haloplanus halophilus TaxID=2949993 RepID=UPI00203C2BA0|nr:DUF5305 domain-containing protein [Haloplanus sp. GDY1]